MTQAASLSKPSLIGTQTLRYSQLLRAFLFGLLLPLGFAPFHFPGLTILGIALFYAQLTHDQNHHPFLNGLFFGLGYFGLGISWIYISIHEYGHLNNFISAAITLFFLLYLSLYPALMAALFKRLSLPRPIYSCFLFSALWILFEFFRSGFLSGFPWLLIGFGQFDSPLKYFLPIGGVFGVGFLCCFSATILGSCHRFKGSGRYVALGIFVLLLILPSFLKHKKWTSEKKESLSVGVIQANLSMRDKWDESLFWHLLGLYKNETEKLLGTELIVMPESAIPLPPSYVEDFLEELHEKAKQAGSAVVLGIPKPTPLDENQYFNALVSLGAAKGFYLKQHLVPFGEYIPKAVQKITAWLAIPDTNLMAGKNNQRLVKIHKHPIATLICYELAYGEILRQQLPQAEWIISISDDGWFGHSLAMYQHLQMAQVRSLESGRYQVVANNDGLSSVINSQGEIIASLPAFSAGVLKATLSPSTGLTPWAYMGDKPIAVFCLIIILLSVPFRYSLWKHKH
ncbi:apolipoprotein N-acyltransferase [Legionella jordanis]|uniref:Apolipoprotein N-acyltransferase n=1 Tax=Legionella jordanis TaxID=456 RepID=A0A0W0V903_9GAMM|nr:apolipoprotein N-acyltransferase [Legionella jordanis]KTD16121.1 apolipoprotein N-acyltransferase [Legionella jordanis]RMX04651.1 apolipoprotein N-acyltransferase [Legionella jordanis]RMX18361.1 apolipoprotein N-acyltransferase [Legionella jordanis]VEH12419.1 apolipoprotein N-acyltransferase [Legionella jordanis]HAT8713931.1 apolipoprotein N-acyltransferase [Legionella jordanis]